MPSGITLMIAGQSNGVQMCTVPVARCNPVSRTYVWQPSLPSWRALTTSDGAGVIELANDLRGNGYDNVYFYDCCYGGSAIIPQLANPSSNCWSPGHPLSDCEAQVAAGGTVPQYVIWIQGEADCGSGLGSQYKVYLDQLRLTLLARWGVNNEQCAWMVTPVSSVLDPSLDIRHAQEEYAGSTPGVFLGPIRDDLALVDGVHLTGPSCITFGDRIAVSLLAYIQEVESMIDAQTAAAIANLQASVTNLQNGIASLQMDVASVGGGIVSLESKIARLQQSINRQQNYIAAIQFANLNLINWPTKWPLKESVT